MRLLMWASSYGNAIGGGPVLAPLLAASLAQRGHEVTVLTDRRPETLPTQEVLDGVSVHRPPFRRALAGDLALVREIRTEVAAIVRRADPEIGYIFSSGYGDYFHHATALLRGRPLIVGLHDCFPASRYEAGTLVGRNLRVADWVVGCSAAVLDRARARLPALTPISSVIHNALPSPPPFTVPGRAAPTLVFVGRLVRKKGVDVLIAAMALLAARFPTLHLAIAGDGPERAALEADVEAHDLAGRVRFLGTVAHDEVAALLAGAEIVVMPSRIEPFGLVALEAAQMARPVVASAVDGLPEVIADGETGLLVRPDDPSSLAMAIAGLLDDPHRARSLGRAAAARASELFGWERYVAAHEALFAMLS